MGRRPPEINRDVLRRRRDQLNQWNVQIRWSGRRPKLWSSVITELEAAERLTAKNTGLVLTMCVNYGSRVEIADAVRLLAQDVAAGKLKTSSISEKTIGSYLGSSWLPDVDLFLRSSGEQRVSNFLLWQSAYAEFVFENTLWPDFGRQELWRAIADYTQRDRRFGGAIDKPKG